MSLNSMALVINQAKVDQSEEILTITAHEIHHGSEKSTLGPGRVFNLNAKESLLSILSQHTASKLEVLSPHCLVTGKETLVWHRPRQKTQVNIQGKELTVPTPSLVFALHRGHLYIAATQGEARPTGGTKLFTCGQPNVSKSGSWCSGGNSMPIEPGQRHINTVERTFFESPFTHWSGAQPTGAGEMESWYNALSGKRTFPMRSLGELSCDLDRWIAQITKDRH